MSHLNPGNFRLINCMHVSINIATLYCCFKSIKNNTWWELGRARILRWRNTAAEILNKQIFRVKAADSWYQLVECPCVATGEEKWVCKKTFLVTFEIKGNSVWAVLKLHMSQLIEPLWCWLGTKTFLQVLWCWILIRRRWKKIIWVCFLALPSCS